MTFVEFRVSGLGFRDSAPALTFVECSSLGFLYSQRCSFLYGWAMFSEAGFDEGLKAQNVKKLTKTPH